MAESGEKGWGRGEVEERLKRISQALIEAYRAKDSAFLEGYARQAGIASETAGAPLNRLFGRVIQVFHPDRLESALERVSRMEGKTAAPAFLEVREFKGRRDAPPKGESGRGYDGEAEEYDFDPEDFGYSEVDAEDPGYADFDDGEGSFAEEAGPMDIVEAIKRAYLGNQEGYPSPLELSMLEGELDLSGMDIDDAEGAQWLRSLSSLNLAGNRIDNCQPLSGMQRLESLDLSDNALEDADALAGLEFLAELDLSGNDIEDFAFLEALPSLRYVNLSGNPALPSALRARLEAKGAIVIQ